jgi:hypothetical protein
VRAAFARLSDANHRALELLRDAVDYGLGVLGQALRGVVEFAITFNPF